MMAIKSNNEVESILHPLVWLRNLGKNQKQIKAN